MSLGTESYRPDIDGLRAVAILTVVAFHSGVPWFGGGFLGVDVFFVISGYLITSLLLHEAEKSGRLDLARFSARRIRRLLMAARWSGYSGERRMAASDVGRDFFDLSAATPEQSVATLRQALDRTLQQLDANRVKTLIMLPVPELKYVAPACLLRWGRTADECGVARQDYLAHRETTTVAITEVSQSYDNAGILDPADYFCSAQLCRAETAGTIMYYDDDHVSASAARGMAAFAKSRLQWLMQ